MRWSLLLFPPSSTQTNGGEVCTAFICSLVFASFDLLSPFCRHNTVVASPSLQLLYGFCKQTGWIPLYLMCFLPPFVPHHAVATFSRLKIELSVLRKSLACVGNGFPPKFLISFSPLNMPARQRALLKRIGRASSFDARRS